MGPPFRHLAIAARLHPVVAPHILPAAGDFRVAYDVAQVGTCNPLVVSKPRGQ